MNSVLRFKRNEFCSTFYAARRRGISPSDLISPSEMGRQVDAPSPVREKSTTAPDAIFPNPPHLPLANRAIEDSIPGGLGKIGQPESLKAVCSRQVRSPAEHAPC